MKTDLDQQDDCRRRLRLTLLPLLAWVFDRAAAEGIAHTNLDVRGRDCRTQGTMHCRLTGTEAGTERRRRMQEVRSKRQEGDGRDKKE